MKKINRLFLVLVLVTVVFLMGCTNSNSEKETTPPQVKTEQQDEQGSNTSEDEKNLSAEEEIPNENPDLEQISILSGKVDILMPKSFVIMPEDMAKLKYPLETRPSLIYTNEDGTVNMAFTHSSSKIKENQISAFQDSLMNSMKEGQPDAKWLDSGIEEINGKSVGYFQLITPAIDTEVYNSFWFTELDGRILMCNFNSTVELMNEWEPVGQEIRNSLRINDNL